MELCGKRRTSLDSPVMKELINGSLNTNKFVIKERVNFLSCITQPWDLGHYYQFVVQREAKWIATDEFESIVGNLLCRKLCQESDHTE